MNYFLLSLFLSFNLFSAAQTVEDDFEGNGTISTWFGDDCGLDISFSNLFQTGVNTSATVLKYSDSGGRYANVRFDVPIHFDLSNDATFSLKLYVPSAGISGSETNQISLKLQEGTIREAWSTQCEIIKPIVLDEWQTITFDFNTDTYININPTSKNPTSRKDFDRVVLQINGEDNTNKVVAYIDDFLYDGILVEDTDSDSDPVFDNLVWSDEFDGNGAINTGNWFQQIRPILDGGQNWANGEIQHYTNRTDNSYVSNGSLKILAKKERYTNLGITKDYTSARLNSKFAFTYGKVEIKAKMPFGVGTFPALWMLGQNITETGGYWAADYGTTKWPDCGEIDIIEHWGSNQDYVSSALHNRSSFGNTYNKGGRNISNASSEFHTYTLEWNANKMIFRVDGIEHYTYDPGDKNSENWPYDAPQYLLFNIAILPNITSSFTQSVMEIDYVRVYQEATASTAANSFKEIKIFPNPINDNFTVKTPSFLAGTKAIIYSLSGSEIKTFLIQNTTQAIACSNLSKGIYFLKLESRDKSEIYKIVKN